ncbi:hypothetical protein TNCV_3725511 [Trichonephila clavipes]|nr:hypothetical protein TNCV_3725511 [Trichonephila clavipes]
MSRYPDQVVSLKRNPWRLVLKQDWHSFIDPLKGWKAKSTLTIPRIEPRTCREATGASLNINLVHSMTVTYTKQALLVQAYTDFETMTNLEHAYFVVIFAGFIVKT